MLQQPQDGPPSPVSRCVAQGIHERNISVSDTSYMPKRPAGARYMGGFRAPALEHVRVAIIGLDVRGLPQTERLAVIPHCSVVGVCDLVPEAATRAADVVEQKGGKRPVEYSGSAGAYLTMLRELRPDAVIINTPWETHASMAIHCMEHGAHAFVEVPLATTLEDLWRVVDTSERTQRHCMMLENVNYGRDELMFLNMVRQGLIGDLLHGEAAYIHELREQMTNDAQNSSAWRTYHYVWRNGCLYPTHGLGPIAQYMNIARRDDTFDRIVSFGSPALGRQAYARKHLPPEHEWNKTAFRCADINTSIIKTKAGRTILVQWDETSPRPYDRRNLIQGTEGTLAGFPTRVSCENIKLTTAEPAEEQGEVAGHHRWYEGSKAVDELHRLYDHPLYKRLGDAEETPSVHGSMNYIMLYRIIECLHLGEALDQNVYEGALWSAVAPLSEKSVQEGGAPQVFPDFTRGDWVSTLPLPILP